MKVKRESLDFLPAIVNHDISLFEKESDNPFSDLA